jgi:hypothetical protein
MNYRFSTILVAIAVLMGYLPAQVFAEPPRVRFDVENAVECRDVTTAEFANVHVTERLIEVSLRISSLIFHGREDELVEYIYQINSPAKTVRVVDYQPKTALTTDVAGNISVEKKDERSQSLGLTLSGNFEQLAKAAVGGDLGSRKSTSVRYERLPDLNLLSSAGMLDGGFGVYFKLKASARTSFEGEKLFRLTLRVPFQWRGDYLHVNCNAVGRRRGFVPCQDSEIHCGSGRFVVAIYLEGDRDARDIAEQLVRAERNLRGLSQQFQNEIEKKSYPSVLHQFGAALDIVEPRISSDWLSRLLFASPSESRDSLPNRLPVDVRVSALKYIEAKEQLFKLAGAGAEKIEQDGVDRKQTWTSKTQANPLRHH